jgi:hypothetical protein
VKLEEGSSVERQNKKGRKENEVMKRNKGTDEQKKSEHTRKTIQQKKE